MTTTETLTYEEFKNNLENFIGTEMYHRIGFTPIAITDGIKYFADECECYWLMEEICYNLYRLHQQVGTLFIEIEVTKRHTVIIKAVEDRDKPVLFQKKIKDICKLIPIDNYLFYLMNNVLLLPSEY